MPSIRKRIGYLPSIKAQETITKIANKEKLSQSKVVGILVEEALKARLGLDIQSNNDLFRKKLYGKENNNDNSYSRNNDLDELISDNGITYNIKPYNNNSEVNVSKSREKFNEELFEQFKQFIIFQEMEKNK
ncbi:hypothetical protein [Prochlorococcus marinus]|uniref:hypothetical protein n=1 Tax=Prochlorococcus marinus TaxID=1219 RepID=UPI0022B37434|nr:hypothetical protein [Prochlorococcus marinus]